MTRKNDTLKRITAFLIAIAVLSVMLFSLIFISGHVRHDCTGTECPVCEVVAQCGDNVRSIGVSIAAVVCTVSFIFYVQKETLSRNDSFRTFSLISQKVRMNN